MGSAADREGQGVQLDRLRERAQLRADGERPATACIETADGGESATETTPSSALIYGAAYASPTQIVAVGESGATVLSNDGGATFTAASLDIGGQYGRLRLGPGGMLLAPGADGDVAISTNAGQSWQVIATQTSQQLVDVAFASPTLGYALDAARRPAAHRKRRARAGRR